MKFFHNMSYIKTENHKFSYKMLSTLRRYQQAKIFKFSNTGVRGPKKSFFFMGAILKLKITNSYVSRLGRSKKL